MITNIKIQNYKCFKEQKEFQCGKLNLFTGINGRGKSSVLQVLLLLGQSMRKSPSLKHLNLKGDYIDLGTYKDIKNSNALNSKNIHLGFDFKSPPFSFALECGEDEKSNYRSTICESNLNSLSDDYKKIIKELFRHIHYVSADRLGPQMFMEKYDLPEFLNVGRRGEYTFEILAQALSLELSVNETLYRGEDANSLLQQTTEWMSYILDGAKIEIKGTDNDSSVLTLLVNNKSDGYMYKPANIGFGYSYILPLVVSGLLAKPGEILIIENPEAHLHPRAQSRIAEFFATVASTGVQVYIETHSEHIVNGVRIACLEDNIKIKNDEVSIFYFGEDFSVSPIYIMSNGKLSTWPKGFFDQKERDLATIFKLSTKRNG
jgi:predicted ATPase